VVEPVCVGRAVSNIRVLYREGSFCEVHSCTMACVIKRDPDAFSEFQLSVADLDPSDPVRDRVFETGRDISAPCKELAFARAGQPIVPAWTPLIAATVSDRCYTTEAARIADRWVQRRHAVLGKTSTDDVEIAPVPGIDERWKSIRVTSKSTALTRHGEICTEYNIATADRVRVWERTVNYRFLDIIKKNIEKQLPGPDLCRRVIRRVLRDPHVTATTRAARSMQLLKFDPDSKRVLVSDPRCWLPSVVSESYRPICRGRRRIAATLRRVWDRDTASAFGAHAVRLHGFLPEPCRLAAKKCTDALRSGGFSQDIALHHAALLREIMTRLFPGLASRFKRNVARYSAPRLNHVGWRQPVLGGPRATQYTVVSEYAATWSNGGLDDDRGGGQCLLCGPDSDRFSIAAAVIAVTRMFLKTHNGLDTQGDSNISRVPEFMRRYLRPTEAPPEHFALYQFFYGHGTSVDCLFGQDSWTCEKQAIDTDVYAQRGGILVITRPDTEEEWVEALQECLPEVIIRWVALEGDWGEYSTSSGVSVMSALDAEVADWENLAFDLVIVDDASFDVDMLPAAMMILGMTSEPSLEFARFFAQRAGMVDSRKCPFDEILGAACSILSVSYDPDDPFGDGSGVKRARVEKPESAPVVRTVRTDFQEDDVRRAAELFDSCEAECDALWHACAAPTPGWDGPNTQLLTFLEDAGVIDTYEAFARCFAGVSITSTSISRRAMGNFVKMSRVAASLEDQSIRRSLEEHGTVSLLPDLVPRLTSQLRSCKTSPFSHECPICLEPVAESGTGGVVVNDCRHVFCASCIAGHYASHLNKTHAVRCPTCRTRLGDPGQSLSRLSDVDQPAPSRKSEWHDFALGRALSTLLSQIITTPHPRVLVVTPDITGTTNVCERASFPSMSLSSTPLYSADAIQSFNRTGPIAALLLEPEDLDGPLLCPNVEYVVLLGCSAEVLQGRFAHATIWECQSSTRMLDDPLADLLTHVVRGGKLSEWVDKIHRPPRRNTNRRHRRHHGA
jgi:hypothetical protein